MSVIQLPCVGGPFDGQAMPCPAHGRDAAYPNCLLKHWEGVERLKKIDLGDKKAVGDVLAELGEPSSRASLYQMRHESLAFVRTLTREEYIAWLVEYTGGGQ